LTRQRDLVKNKKAKHDFHMEETFEAGIALEGTEVKSLRSGKASLRDSYARVENGELYLYDMHISPYEKGNRFNHDPKRPRKLLMHKREIMRLYGYVREKGYTLVPLRLYLNEKGLIKVELALARGKRIYDKRREIAKRDAERQMEKALKEKYKY